MCELCGMPEEKEKAVEHHKYIAKQLEHLAFVYYQIARGNIKPHTPDMAIVEKYARPIVKELIEWW